MSIVFWKRRKILKSVNALELIPVAVVKYEVTVDRKVSLVIPRFNNKFLRRIFTGARVNESYMMSLDKNGSLVWLSINGEKTIGAISKEISEYYKTTDKSFENAEERISEFLTRLYQEGCISFKQLL